MKSLKYLVAFLFFAFTAYALEITSPSGGFIQNKMIHLNVSDTPALMKINYNGIPFIAKSNGSFERDMLVARGFNSFVVSDYKNPFIQDSVSFYADVPPTAMKIILFWDTDHTDIDLHVIEPDGTECYYAHKNTKLGGCLDVDVTTGYGPEIYTMQYPNRGEYTINIYYYGGSQLTEAQVHVILYEGTSKEIRKSFVMMLTKPGVTVHVGKVKID